MEKFQFLLFLKKPAFILALILSVFFLKGVFLTAITPIFEGVDEPDHFNTIQYLSEPRPITWPLIDREETEKNTTHIRRYNYSQEIKETAVAIGYDESFDDVYTTFSFAQGYNGKNEMQVYSNGWHKYNEYNPPNLAPISLYHRLASVIEKTFDSQSIFVRYFLIRIFSVLLGTLTVLFSYLIAKNIGFSAKNSLLLTAIIAFQPRFSIYYSTINYDALLILFFTLFTLGGILALKNGLHWKNVFLIVASVCLGIPTKPTATVLLVGAVLLFIYFLYEKIKDKSKQIKYLACLIFVCAIASLLIYLKGYFPTNIRDASDLIISIKDYLLKNLTIGKFDLSSRTYWGAITWTNAWFIDNAINIIWMIQAIAAVGIAFFIFSKKKPEHLPEKKYIIFLLMMIVLLQFGIRTADWIFFKQKGVLTLGAPGRYFIPNMTAHIILVFTGIGMLLRKKEWFEKSLVIGLILMIAFMIYIIFDTIIFRYYF